MARMEAHPDAFVKRFEALKKMWFARPKPRLDSQGEEAPSALPGRAEMAQMFEQMGVEIPMSPTDAPVLIQK